MGTFIEELGKLHIPEEKKAQFIKDAKEVAFQGGLFSRSYTHIKGNDLFFLSFPSFEEGKYADFTYSYFENAPWENAGIRLKDALPYSEKIGWLQFNQVVQALYILAELYSTTPYVSYNDSAECPEEMIQWLRYLLGRNLQYQWRWDVWKIYESYAKRKMLYHPDPKVDIDFLDDVLPKDYDAVGLLNAAFVSYGIDHMLAKRSGTEAEKAAEDPSQRVFTIDDFVYMLKQRIMEYKANASDNEDQQIQFLLHYLTCDPGERDINKCEEQHKGLLIAIVFTTPQIIVKTISEIYQKSFWSLWAQVKDSITLDAPGYFNQKQPEQDDELMTTEDFLGISGDDRLYWWREDGDVCLSDNMKNWLDQMADRFAGLLREELSGSNDVWMDRLVSLIAGNQKILFFENLFYEFLRNLDKNEYKAAIRLLEENRDHDKEYKNLIAVFANCDLRRKVLGF